MDIDAPSYRNWVNFLAEEFPSSIEIKNRHKIEKGQIIHEMLSLIDKVNSENFDDQIKIAEEKLKRNCKEKKLINECIEKLKQVLTNEKTQNFFFCKNKTIVHREKEYIDKNGRIHRLDRVIVNDDLVQIVDFKSSKEGYAEHVSQVKEYMDIVKEVYKNKKVEGYLLYMDKLELEKV